jgi:hypothetical protein
MNSTLNATLNMTQNLSSHIARAIVTFTPSPTSTPIKGLVFLNGKIQEVPVIMGTPLSQKSGSVVVDTFFNESWLQNFLNWPAIDLIKVITIIGLGILVLWALSSAEKAVVNYWGILKSRREHDRKEMERKKP